MGNIRTTLLQQMRSWRSSHDNSQQTKRGLHPAGCVLQNQLCRSRFFTSEWFGWTQTSATTQQQPIAAATISQGEIPTQNPQKRWVSDKTMKKVKAPKVSTIKTATTAAFLDYQREADNKFVAHMREQADGDGVQFQGKCERALKSRHYIVTYGQLSVLQER